MSKVYYKDIDVVKGIAIILVVAGHILGGDLLIYYPNYAKVRLILYSFHIPVFYFLAGITFNISYSRSSRYLEFIRKKSIRLMLPFIFFSGTVLLGKHFAQNVGLYVPNRVTDWVDFVHVIIKPNESAVEYLWFIYVLFMFYVTTPAIIFVLKNKLFFWGILLLLLFFLLPDTNLFAITKYKQNIIFFISGYLVYNFYPVYLYFIKKYGLFFVPLFLLELLYFSSVYQLIIAFTAIIMIHSLVYKLNVVDFKIVEMIGKDSYSVYLMHMLFMGIINAILIKIYGPEHLGVFSFICVFIVGLFMPMILMHILVNRSARIRKFI